ncbi:TIGR01777 family oxidoreductase [Pedobacter sp. SL55]|uniref:TIGR01777 family oxidoreductase n=1 Tax=Pedobacter sp. SL55 TaxID=2995161 RepID=UPI0022701A50|nr:TIGR01777 family oxidoreductase [Pedobacter sp. SL55]WAC42300.1 TIGR01777 family oxidoreductase [Pedobacter sp. SL55]
MAKNILIAGATGLVGQQLVSKLLANGYQVSILARKPSTRKDVKVFTWDVYQQTIDYNAFNGIDTIINLTGEGIADKPWTQERKQQIIDSRVKAAELIFKAVAATNATIESYISASAVGIYGDRADEILNEESLPGIGFMADCCLAWEKAADQGIALGIRVVKIRIGIVLSEKGGALPTMEKPVKLFAGTALGSGKQWMPWIHLDDLVNIFVKAVEDQNMFDAYNAAAPSPVTNQTFTKTLGKVLHRPIWPINVPKFMLKIILGEMSILPLISTNTSSQKILNTGFQFAYLNLEETLKAIYERKK